MKDTKQEAPVSAGDTVKKFQRCINALALELPEAVWNDVNKMWNELKSQISQPVSVQGEGLREAHQPKPEDHKIYSNIINTLAEENRIMKDREKMFTKTGDGLRDFMPVLIENYEATKRMSEYEVALTTKYALIEAYEDLIQIYKKYQPVSSPSGQEKDAVAKT